MRCLVGAARTLPGYLHHALNMHSLRSSIHVSQLLGGDATVLPPRAPRNPVCTCTAPTHNTPRARRRLDDVCVDLRPDLSRNVLQSFIVQGKVHVNGTPQTKAGFQVPPSAVVEILAELPKYVCRAGHKLEAALDAFGVDPSGRVCLDAGLSTGGFTDCLLQRGAAAVYGVDVGYGQVAERIRTDPRVVVMERTNVRHLTASQMPPLPGTANAPLVDLVTLDLSFISVLKVLPAVVAVMQPNAQLIVLIKPQFEAGREQVNEGGVVRDPAVRAAVVEQVVRGVEALGFASRGHIASPIRGASKGNHEYLAHFVKA